MVLGRLATVVVVAGTLSACSAASLMQRVDRDEVRSDLQSWNAEVYEQGAELNGLTERRVAEVDAAQKATHAEPARAISLYDLYEEGIGNNLNLVVAKKSIDVADAELANATFRFFPSLNGTASAVLTNQNILASDNQVFQKGQATYPTYNAILEAKMPIVNLENVFNHRKATAATRKAHVEYIGTAQTYVRDLIVAYLDLAEANAIIAEYQEKVRLLGNRAETERQLLSANSGRPEIVASFEQQLSDAKAHLISDQARRREATARLYQLTGIDVTQVKGGVRMADLKLPANDLQNLRILAPRSNVRYLAKQYEADILMEGLNEARSADFGPKVNAFATAEYEDRGGSQFGGGSTTVQSTVGVELKVPLFNPEGNGYRTLPATAERELALAELAQLLREIDSDLSRAYYGYTAARDRLRDDNRTVARGEDILYLVNQRIESENAVRTEGLQSALEQAEFVRQRQQVIYEILREWVSIKYLLGAVSEADIVLFSGGAS